MIEAIIFDFDGVIVESADIKTDAFRELFRDYPEQVDEIVDYHLKNAGISRYVKFRYMYEHLLAKELSKKKETELGTEFSRIVLEKVLVAPFVPGAKDFLSANKDRYMFFIASGTPEEELRDIVHERGLEEYFREVHGSPGQKKDIINGIIERYGLSRDEVVYVGDAESDRIAAEQTKVAFVERKSNLEPERREGLCVVEDLTHLSKILEKIEENNRRYD